MFSFKQVSPNMLKMYELCPRKFYFKFVKNISMPVNDDIFEFGKNIHALASYYLRGENIEGMELSLTPKELIVWEYLKSIKYFSLKTLKTEYYLSVKINNVFYGGRIDALVGNTDDIYILDYKTGSVPKNAKYDYQTMIYTLAVSEYFHTNNVKFVYIDLKNKDEITIRVNEELLQEYKKLLISAYNKISIDDIPPKKLACHCEYAPICY